METIEDQIQLEDINEDELKRRPWFVIFNAYYGPMQTVFYWFDPFPADQFPPHSPWEDCRIVAHFGIEPYAKSAGFVSVDLYLRHLIHEAAIGREQFSHEG